MAVAGHAIVPFEGEFSALNAKALQSVEAVTSKFKGILGPVGIVGAAITGIGAITVDMATKFETATTQLITGAGESAKAIDMVRKGILAMAPAVGDSPVTLAKALYMIESAGYHGAAGLTVLKTAAEGARVGNADLTTVADALTSALNAYHLGASSAVMVTNELIGTEKVGKLHLEDLAGALGSILAPAAAANVSLAEVGGAISTMTMQGTDANRATQSLRFLLAALQGPTSAAAGEMRALGIGTAQIPGITAAATLELSKLGVHSSEVAYTLTHQGLQAALDEITTAIGKKFPVGSAQYNAALRGAVGGTRGFTAALELTGSNMATFIANTKEITKNATDGGKAVDGWSLIQQNFGQKMAEAKAGIDAFGVTVGTALLPVVSRLADTFLTKVLPALDRFAVWIINTGIPDLLMFGSWVGTYVVSPLTHVASVVIPLLLDAFGFVVGHMHEIMVVAAPLGALLAGMWAVDKIGAWASTARSAIQGVLASLGLVSAAQTGGPTSALSAVKGVQSVYVTNWAMMGGGAAAVEGDAAKIGSATTSSLMSVLGPIAIGSAALLAVGFGLQALVQKIDPTKRTSAPLSPDAPGVKTSVWSGTGSDIMNQLQGQYNAAYLAYLEGLAKASGHTLTSWLGIQAASKTLAGIVGEKGPKAQVDLTLLESQWEQSGISAQKAADVVDLMSTFITKHGPLTKTETAAFFDAVSATNLSWGQTNQASNAISTWMGKHGSLTVAQLQAFKDDLDGGVTSAFDIALSMKSINIALAPAVDSATRFADAIGAGLSPARAKIVAKYSRAGGGPITEDVIGVGLDTGAEWSFHKDETVIPNARLRSATATAPTASGAVHFHAGDIYIQGATEAALVSKLRNVVEENNAEFMLAWERATGS